MSRILLVAALLVFQYYAPAQVTDINGPAGSGKFGATVTVLPNGNFVVTDPLFDEGGVVNIGAVYLFSGTTNAVIGVLKGTTLNDSIGSAGITVLANGNFLVRSPNWDNGGIHNAGAITWCNATQTVSATINSSNSLVGNSANEQLGIQNIIKLSNGNYVVRDQNWSNGNTTFAGAAIWGDASSPLTGVVDANVALVGSQTNDRVGYDIIPLNNGNYLVSTPFWSNSGAFSAGAVTWCNGTTGRTGVVSSVNSLVGTHASDRIGEGGITRLTNGNYVVKSPSWNVFAPNPNDMGAVTWGSGSAGIAGPVSNTNSLVKTGPTPAGSPMVTALPNGNYVVVSPGWGKSGLNCAGAITWADGTTGISGDVTSSNSLVGSNAVYPAQIFIVPLSNGNYVISYPTWNYGTGAVKLASGISPLSGIIMNNNSLTGNQAGDYVGIVTALFNGNYVVSSPSWSINAPHVGAITLCDGVLGKTGFVTAANSIIGSHSFDQIGSGGIIPLINNKYVICSPLWDNGSIPDVGAVTLMDGTLATSGSVDAVNSMIGTHLYDQVGSGGILPLTNGNYVIASPDWDTASAADAGAVTWVDANGSGTGTVGAGNSLVGTHFNDHIGYLLPLSNGNYVIMSADWNNNAGSVTWGSASSGVTGAITAANSLIGNQANDRIGFDNSIVQLNNGNYVVRSPYYSNGALINAGAVTWCSGISGNNGIVDSTNSLVGVHANDGLGYGVGYTILTSANSDYSIRNMNWDNGSIADAGAVTWASGSAMIFGTVTPCNSVQGGVTVSTETNFLTSSFNEVYNSLIVGRPAENKISIYNPTGISIPPAMDSGIAFIQGNAPVPLYAATGCHIICTVTPNSSQPVGGLVQAKTWLDTALITTNNVFYAGRHYEVFPLMNAATATAKVTLYFTQNDFDLFNANTASNLQLPANMNDNSGKARLRIVKYAGVSAGNTGLPASYPGTAVWLDPADNDIVWNAQLQRWEVSFDVNGFSGFFVGTVGTPLPLYLISFNGTLVAGKTVLDWQTTEEKNSLSFEVERSKDAVNYYKIGTVPAANLPGTHQYQFVDNDPGRTGVSTVFYRLKLLDVDNSFVYSRIVVVNLYDPGNIFLLGNPVADKLSLVVNTKHPEIIKVRIVDNTGRELKKFEWKVNPGGTTLVADVHTLASGAYYLDLRGDRTQRTFLIFKN